MYIKTSKELQASIVFSSGTSFLGCRILLSQSKPFVIYNIYSHGGRDTAFEEHIKTFTPDESSILIGDFNCHHPWWYGNIKSTKNHMKTRQLSANTKVIVDWLESQNYKLHNKPGIETHYPSATARRNRNPLRRSISDPNHFIGTNFNLCMGWYCPWLPTPLIVIRKRTPEERTSNRDKLWMNTTKYATGILGLHLI
jgi:hypothetical protein